MEGNSSIVGGPDGDLSLTMKEFPILAINETGDGTNIITYQSSVSSAGRESELIDGMGDSGLGANPDTSGPATDTTDESFYMQTTVEVCVKMVVCRKYITNTVDSKTGQVVSCSFSTEEDPPTILQVHTYKKPTEPTGLPTAISPTQTHTVSSLPTHTPTIKRRPGRPRKHPPSLIPAPQLKTTISGKHAVTANRDTESADVATGETKQISVSGSENNQETKMETDTLTTVSADSDKSRVKASITASGLASMSVSLKKEKQKISPSVPFKRRLGRPSRVIKKPRKYLDSFDEDFFKPESAEEPEEGHAEEESGEEEEEKEEEEKKEEKGSEEETEEGIVKQHEENVGDGENEENVEDEDGFKEKTECPKCKKKFSNPSNCQRHIVKDRCSHQHQCGFCEKLFVTRSLLESHMESHRDQECQNNYRCGDCNRTYATRNGYLKHKRQGTCYKRDMFHEDGTQGEFACDLCQVRFTTDKLLELHKEKVHENPNNEYKCPDCNRVFYSKLGFTKHVAKKTCTQPHECKVCGKKYSNKAKESFKSHMRYHLAETSGVQFQCEDCGRVYMSDMALKKHRMTSHSGMRPFKCGTCSKTFPMRYMVRDHERSHTGERPFLCNLCGTSFGNRGHLYRHMRSHSLGTLHKRGRPRKYPAKPLLIKLKEGEEEGGGQEVFEDLVVREGAEGELGVVEFKTDVLQQDVVQEEMGSLSAGPTYITVHTVDGQLGDAAASQGIMGEGQLQHVVMETPDGMSDNMVLQVIRDLTGATTVYQQITDQSATGSSIVPVSAEASQIIMSAAPQQVVSQAVMGDPTTTDSMGQAIVTGHQLTHSSNPQHRIIVASPSKLTPVTQAFT